MSDVITADVLAEILASLHRIESAMPAMRPQRHDELRRLVPALVGAVGSEPFKAIDVLEYPAVRAASSRSLSPESLGKLLASAVGRVIDGYRVERLGRGQWRIVQMV